jgi:hypothetical protein
MTPAKKKALALFYQAEGALTPRMADIRTDVARALFDDGLVEPSIKNDLFRGGYAPLKITEKGRLAHLGKPAATLVVSEPETGPKP